MVAVKRCFTTLLAFLLIQVTSSKENVYIPVLAPLYGDSHDRYGYSTAMKYAFELINKREDILRDYNLVPQIYDTVGAAAQALYHTMQVMDQGHCHNNTRVPPAVIGPAFSKPTVAVAKITGYLLTLLFAYGATTPVLDNYSVYPYVIKTVPGTLSFNEGYLKLMKTFNWKRVGILFDHNEQDGIFNKNTESLINEVKLNNFTVVGVESVHAGSSSIIATSDSEIQQRLEKLKAADIKIFFGQFNWIGAYRIFCQVYKLGMFGKSYVWIVHPRTELVDKWMETPKRFEHLKTNCTREQYQKVSEGMLFMDQQTLRPDSKVTISGLTSTQYNDYVNQHRPKQRRDSPFHNTTFHAYSFDTVWTVALALNNSVGVLRKFGISLDSLTLRNHSQVNLIKQGVFKVKYEGVTGPISFNRDNAGRIIGSLTLNQMRGNKAVTLGNFDVVTKELHRYPEAFNYMWIDGKVPLDKSYQRTILLTVPLVLYVAVTAVAGLGVILSIGVLFFNIYNRNRRYIRKSAPMFNNLIVIGIILSLSTVAFFGFPVKLGETEKFLWSCKLRSWVLCLGFSLSFGSMFVKTWRVYKIFTNRRLKYSIDRLSNTSLFVMIISIVAVDLIILSLWDILDPVEVKITKFPLQADAQDSNTVLVPIFYTCYSFHQSKWITAIYTIKGILLLYGLFLAYETRNVQFDHLNDSRMIGVCVYNVAVMSVLGALLRIILNETYYRESFGISSVCIIFPSLGTLLLIFLPKGKRLILGIESSPSGYSRVVRFVKNGSETETTAEGGMVYEGPATKVNGTSLQLRKCSVDSEGVTSLSSSLPMSSSRIMPIYEEASSVTNGVNDEPLTESTTDNSRQSLSSSSNST